MGPFLYHRSVNRKVSIMSHFVIKIRQMENGCREYVVKSNAIPDFDFACNKAKEVKEMDNDNAAVDYVLVAEKDMSRFGLFVKECNNA